MKFKHKKLERYKYVKDIGSGAQGEVVKVKDDSGREVYALKLLKNEEGHDMFKGEIEALKLLNHRNVVRIYDASVEKEEGEAFILMDYMKHGNIKEYLNENEKISVYHKLLMIQDVAKALQYIHQQNYLHRDIKPANIFVTDDGNGAYACLGDFGIAKRIEGDVTETGKLEASYLYCPLEVLSGNEKQNEQSDIYGLGMSMYEIFRGTHPQKDRNVANYIQSMGNNISFEKLSNYDSLLDEKIDEVCLKSIDKDKAKRYSTVEELVNDLKECLSLCDDKSEIVTSNTKQEKIEIKETYQEVKNIDNEKNVDEKGDGKGKIGIFGIIVQKASKMWEDFLLEKAAEDPKAMIRLARMYTNDQREASDMQKGIQYYKMAIAGAESTQAMMELGEIYFSGKGEIEEDVKQASLYYQMAAEKGDVKAYGRVVELHKHKMIKDSVIKGIQLHYEKLLNANRIKPFELNTLGNLYRINSFTLTENYEKAKKCYEKAMKKGNIEAILSLANLYRYGYGVKKDDEKMLELYEKAAKKGSDVAFFEIGQFYSAKGKNKPDYIKALYCFERAVRRKGKIRYMLAISELYEEGGFGLEKDIQKAQEYHKKALDNATRNEAYEEGGVYKDVFFERFGSKKRYGEKAIELYEKAIEKGSKNAFIELAELYQTGGVGIPRDYERAKYYYEKALDKGKKNATYRIGNLYMYGGYGLEKDSKKAEEYYLLGVEKGVIRAKILLSELYKKGGDGIRIDYKKARRYYNQALYEATEEELNDIGELYRNGYGVEKNYSQAIEWFKKSYEKGNKDMLRILGDMYREGGHGIVKNFARAKQYYEKSCEEGDTEALRLVGDLYSDGSEGIEKDFLKAKEYYLRYVNITGDIGKVNYDFFRVIQKTGLTEEEVQIVEKGLKDQGGGDAMKRLGDLYENGFGVEKNYLMAKKYYEQAIKQGNTSSFYLIASLYERGGHGIEQNDGKVIEYYKRGVEVEDVNCLERLAEVYEAGGYGVDKDFNKAKYYYIRIIELETEDLVSSMLLRIRGRSRSTTQLLNFAEQVGFTREEFSRVKNCLEKRNDNDAVYDLGRLYSHGYSVEKNYQKAKEYYEKAYKNGDKKALTELVKIYEQGGYGLDKDQAKANEYKSMQ